MFLLSYVIGIILVYKDTLSLQIDKFLSCFLSVCMIQHLPDGICDAVSATSAFRHIHLLPDANWEGEESCEDENGGL